MSYKSATTALARDQASPMLSHPKMVGGGRRGAAEPVPADARVEMVRDILLALVRRDGRDLTARQLSAFMIVYTQDEVQTVSSLAERMNISRPGVTRVMDRLVEFDLMAREEDREDRRRVLARRTTRGVAFHRDLVALARAASEGRLTVTAPGEQPVKRSRG